MSANAPAAAASWIGRWAVRLAALALGAGVCPVGLPGPSAAVSQTSRPPWDTLRQADDHYRAGRLPQAEGLYRSALSQAKGADRKRCYERLLAIYAQTGRQDQAIALGLRYADWLRATGGLARARELALDLGGWYLALGHYAAAEQQLRRGIADLEGIPLPPPLQARQITALTQLGVAVEKQGDRARAASVWRQVEELAQGRLERPAQKITPRERLACVHGLVECYRFRGGLGKAIPLLEGLLPAYDTLEDPAGKRDTLRLLAGHLAAGRKFAEAEKRFQEALALHESHFPDDRLTRAELGCELADVLEQRGRTLEARQAREKAAGDYEAVLKGQRTGAESLAAFWRLNGLYQRTCRYRQALTLTEATTGQWGGPLLEARFTAELGLLKAVLDRNREAARRLLLTAVHTLEQQSPANLFELPRALATLGAVELASGSRAAAQGLGERTRKLYQDHRLPDDLVLVEAYNLLGTCAAQDGDYSAAIDLYREGVTRCTRLGRAADPERCGLLLNMALLLRAQGDLERALEQCREARAAYQRFAVPDSPGLAAFDAALASMLAAQGGGKLDEANALATEVLRLCAMYEFPEKSLLVTTARHCQALHHLFHRELSSAEGAWQEVRKLHGDRSPLLPRTLNYLALTRECQGQFADAARLYEQARRLQKAAARAFPVTHFTTLWRLAELADRRGEKAEARALLEEAVAVVEAARLRVYGDARQRAAFFAQFAPAFERLVEWGARDGDAESALCAAARGRSRTLLDQLLMAGVDPRAGLGAERRELLRREEDLKRQVAGLRARAQLAPEETPQLQAAIDKAQQEYTEVFREVLNASPVYRSLAQPEFTRAALARLRARAVGPKRMLLVYHVGRQRSHLLLLDGRSGQAAAFPLRVPGEVAERIALAGPEAPRPATPRTRGLVLQPLPQEQPELPARGKGGTAAALGQSVLRALVETYLNRVADPGFRPTRGIRFWTRYPSRPLPAQRPDLLADILLPPEVRQRIRASAPECLIVVPDGALHKLPLEALLLEAGEKPVYVLDELPPLVYAPSVAALAVLADRAAVTQVGPLSLLSVADPAYPQAKAGARTTAGPEAALLLPPLPGTAAESARISRLFEQGQVKALSGRQATKRAVVAALPGRSVVHLAAHGLADQRFGNLFGTLALTPSPPEKGVPGDDGLLYLHEIYTLPLRGCELAVLSACVTNVGPQQPLEAGVTLANGFLTAGARHVVASHWGVADEATAELMGVFFEEVTAAGRRGGAVAYPQALQRARQRVRQQAKWSSPFYWAPFVLIGPAG
jgi:CHAT domain-containing protein